MLLTASHGSDQEKAMCKAMDYAFPSAAHLTCTRHMRGNAEDYMRDSIGVSEADRARVIDTIFGKNGLAEADESVLFDSRLQLAREACRKIAPAFERHFDECIVEDLLWQPSVPEAAAAAILVLGF